MNDNQLIPMLVFFSDFCPRCHRATPDLWLQADSEGNTLYDAEPVCKKCSKESPEYRADNVVWWRQ